MPREFTPEELMAAAAIEAANWRDDHAPRRPAVKRPSPEQIRETADLMRKSDLRESDLRYVRFVAGCLLLAVAAELDAKEAPGGAR